MDLVHMDCVLELKLNDENDMSRLNRVLTRRSRRWWTLNCSTKALNSIYYNSADTGNTKSTLILFGCNHWSKLFCFVQCSSNWNSFQRIWISIIYLKCIIAVYWTEQRIENRKQIFRKLNYRIDVVESVVLYHMLRHILSKHMFSMIFPMPSQVDK